MRRLTALLLLTISSALLAEPHTFGTSTTPDLITVDPATQIFTVREPGTAPVTLDLNNFPYSSIVLTEPYLDGAFIRLQHYDYPNPKYDAWLFTTSFNVSRLTIQEYSPLSSRTYTPLTQASAPPPPPAVVTMTTEDLQATAGVFEVPGVGVITIPWEQMNPQEIVTVYPDDTTLAIDATTPATPSIRIEFPASITSYTVESVAAGPTPTGSCTAPLATQALDEEVWPWALYDADEPVEVPTTPGILEQTIVTWFGQTCTYTEGPILVEYYREEACQPEPPLLTDIISAVAATRNATGPGNSEGGFELEPIQKLRVLVGPDAPKEASFNAGWVNLNGDWIKLITTQDLLSAVAHETCHAVHTYTLGRTVRNWFTEAAAVYCEDVVGISDFGIRQRYGFDEKVTRRGLDGTVIRDPATQELYNPAFFQYIRNLPGFNLADLMRDQGQYVLANNPIEAFAQHMDWDFAQLIDQFARSAQWYHEGLAWRMEDAVPPLTPVDLEAGVSLVVGDSVVWNNTEEGRVCLIVEVPEQVNFDTWLVVNPKNWNATFNNYGVTAFEGGSYKLKSGFLNRLVEGEHVFTLTSVSGRDFNAPNLTVNLRVTRDIAIWNNCESTDVDETPCEGGGPQLFDGSGEAGTAYNGACNDLGYNVTITQVASSFICPDTPGIDEVGKYTVRYRFGGDIRDLPWPHRVVGARTNGKVPDQYWPAEFEQPPNPGGCDRLGVRTESWYDIHSSNTYQTVSWYWNCANGGDCGTPGSRPPAY